MTRLYGLLTMLLLLCLQNNFSNAAKKTGSCAVNHRPLEAQYALPADTSYLADLSNLKKALIAGDKERAKTFFNFPVSTEDNTIWHLAYAENKKLLAQLPDGPKPFTEKDFEVYFVKLFPKNFLAALQQLNLVTLSKKAEAETISFRQSQSTTCKLYAVFDSIENTLSLNMGFQKVVKNKKGRIEEEEEYGTQYVFLIVRNGHLQFKRIQYSA